VFIASGAQSQIKHSRTNHIELRVGDVVATPMRSQLNKLFGQQNM
jgi:hypothetical protein